MDGAFWKSFTSTRRRLYAQAMLERWWVCLPPDTTLPLDFGRSTAVTDEFIDCHVLQPSPMFVAQYVSGGTTNIAVRRDGSVLTTTLYDPPSSRSTSFSPSSARIKSQDTIHGEAGGAVIVLTLDNALVLAPRGSGPSRLDARTIARHTVDLHAAAAAHPLTASPFPSPPLSDTAVRLVGLPIQTYTSLCSFVATKFLRALMQQVEAAARDSAAAVEAYPSSDGRGIEAAAKDAGSSIPPAPRPAAAVCGMDVVFGWVDASLEVVEDAVEAVIGAAEGRVVDGGVMGLSPAYARAPHAVRVGASPRAAVEKVEAAVRAAAWDAAVSASGAVVLQLLRVRAQRALCTSFAAPFSPSDPSAPAAASGRSKSSSVGASRGSATSRPQAGRHVEVWVEDPPLLSVAFPPPSPASSPFLDAVELLARILRLEAPPVRLASMASSTEGGAAAESAFAWRCGATVRSLIAARGAVGDSKRRAVVGVGDGCEACAAAVWGKDAIGAGRGEGEVVYVDEAVGTFELAFSGLTKRDFEALSVVQVVDAVALCVEYVTAEGDADAAVEVVSALIAAVIDRAAAAAGEGGDPSTLRSASMGSGGGVVGGGSGGYCQFARVGVVGGRDTGSGVWDEGLDGIRSATESVVAAVSSQASALARACARAAQCSALPPPTATASSSQGFSSTPSTHSLATISGAQSFNSYPTHPSFSTANSAISLLSILSALCAFVDVISSQSDCLPPRTVYTIATLKAAVEVVARKVVGVGRGGSDASRGAGGLVDAVWGEWDCVPVVRAGEFEGAGIGSVDGERVRQPLRSEGAPGLGGDMGRKAESIESVKGLGVGFAGQEATESGERGGRNGKEESVKPRGGLRVDEEYDVGDDAFGTRVGEGGEGEGEDVDVEPFVWRNPLLDTESEGSPSPSHTTRPHFATTARGGEVRGREGGVLAAPPAHQGVRDVSQQVGGMGALEGRGGAPGSQLGRRGGEGGECVDESRAPVNRTVVYDSLGREIAPPVGGWAKVQRDDDVGGPQRGEKGVQLKAHSGGAFRSIFSRLRGKKG